MQRQFAEYLFLAPQTVSRWESGGGTPDIALLPKIAAFFGISIDELFGATSLERTALEMELLMCLLKVYDGEKLAALKGRLLSLLPQAGLDPYFEEKAREKINLA